MKKIFELLKKAVKWLLKNIIWISIIVSILCCIYSYVEDKGFDKGYEQGYEWGFKAALEEKQHYRNTLENLKALVDHELETLNNLEDPSDNLLEGD